MPRLENPVVFASTAIRLRRSQLREFAGRLREEVAEGRPFTCLIAGDRRLRRLNHEFRGKDCPTDVLSFPSGEQTVLGDIAVSAARAASQAAAAGHSVEDEIAVLMLHGLLHLMGYDHETDRGRMARAEKRWRARLGIPCVLARRARTAARESE